MTEIEKEVEIEKKSFLLKGIENVFLKFKGVKRPSQEELMIAKAQQQAEQERQQAIEAQARIEAENARQYHLFQEQLKKEQEAAEQQRFLEIQEKQNNLIKQADMFLSANLYDLYLTMCNNGYQPNKNQKQRFVEHINDIILNLQPDVDLNMIENYINMGYKLSSSNSFQLLSQPYFQHKFFNKELFDLSNPILSDVKYPKLIENLKSNLRTDFFQDYIGKKFLSCFNIKQDYNIYGNNRHLIRSRDKFQVNLYEIANIPMFITHMGHIVLPKVSVEKFIDLISQWTRAQTHINLTLENNELPVLLKVKTQRKIDKEQIYQFHERSYNFYADTDMLLKTTLREHYSKDIEQLLHNSKVVFSENYIEEKVVKNTQNLSSNYKVNNLPENTKEIFHELQKLYDKLEKHIPHLNDDQKFLVENLFDKRIPEVLQKYFSIDQEYRTTLTNSEGKNAKDLMDESLTNFKNKLIEVLENINTAKLSDLSVTKRYSKSI